MNTRLLCGQRAAIHKRLMPTAILSLLPPALGRITSNFDREHTPVMVLAVMCAFVCVYVVIDVLRADACTPRLGGVADAASLAAAADAHARAAEPAASPWASRAHLL